MNPELLRRAIQLDHAVSDRLSEQSYRNYLNRIVINSTPPQRFGKIAEPWQWDRVAAMEAAVEYVAGYRSHYDGPLNFWATMPKGCDKSSSIARLLNWLLGYSKTRLKMYAAAADADQARLIRDAMWRERELNPFLKRRVQIMLKAAWGRGGQLEILASDSASAQGKLPDVIVVDELTHWHDRAFFDALYSARYKRKACLVFVITNAGIRGSWQDDLRRIAMSSDRWHFHEVEAGTHPASWMDQKAIDDEAKMLAPTEFRRLLKNEWLDPGETCGFVLLDDALACRTRSVGGGSARSRYFASVDYGPRRDRTALSLLRRDADAEPLSLADLQCWHRPGGEVQIEEVERWIEAVHTKQPQTTFVFDEYQMLGTIQKYEKLGYRIERFAPRGGAANYEMAANLRSLIASRRIRWEQRSGPTLPHTDVLVSGADTFEDELSQLLLRVTPSGYRFDHKSGKHDDRAVAVGMAALFAVSAKPTAEFAPPTPIAASQFDFKSPPRRTFFGV